MWETETRHRIRHPALVPLGFMWLATWGIAEALLGLSWVFLRLSNQFQGATEDLGNWLWVRR